MLTNEEIALKISNGESEYINLLYEQCRKLIDMYAGKYYRRNTELCINSGVELDDLKVCGFFALPEAVRAYCNSNKDFKFNSFLKYPLLSVFNDTVGIRTSKAKREALNGYISLYTTYDEEQTELIDTISDSNAEFEEKVVDKINYKNVFDKTREILKNDLKSDTIYKRYFLNMSLKQISKSQERSISAVEICLKNSLKELKKDLYFTELAKDIFGGVYKKSGFNHFKTSGYSSVEWAIEKLEDIREEKMRIRDKPIRFTIL